MSFIQYSAGSLVKDLWPSPLAMTVDNRSTQDLEHWQIVPFTFADICEWAYVAKRQVTVDYTRLYNVLYKCPDGDPSAIYPVVLRLQGVLGRFELSPLGAWNGSPETAASAIQYITLLSGGHTDIWQSTNESIRLIRQLVHSSLEGANPFIEPTANNSRNIYVQRRIFNKVNSQLGDQPSVLAEGDDPHGWTPTIAKQWRVTERLQIGSRMQDGRTVACSPFVLSRGDFIDIGIMFDISTSRTPNGRIRNNVHLSIVHVLQLLPVCMINESNAPNLSNQLNEKTTHGVAAKQVPVEYCLGMTFDNVHEPNMSQDIDDSEQI